MQLKKTAKLWMEDSSKKLKNISATDKFYRQILIREIFMGVI